MAKPAVFRVSRAARDLLRELDRLDDATKDQLAGELAEVGEAITYLLAALAEEYGAPPDQVLAILGRAGGQE